MFYGLRVYKLLKLLIKNIRDKAKLAQIRPFVKQNLAYAGETAPEPETESEILSDRLFEEGESYKCRGQWEKAMECFTRGIKTAPSKGNNYSGLMPLSKKCPENMLCPW